MYSKVFACVLTLLIQSASVHAQENKSKGSCQPTSYEALLSCAESQSLESQIVRLRSDAASELEGVAAQFLNPDLELESIRKDSDKSETSASLMFNVSLGGRRSALKAEARAERDKITAESELSLSVQRLDLIKQLYQLSHLQREIAIEEESFSTFNKIISQFSRRAALTPEQEVSASIFKMAVVDHQLNHAKLKNSEQEVLANIMRVTNLDREQILKNLPQRKSAWPEVSSADVNLKNSPHIRVAEAELQMAKSKKDRVVAETYPDLKIGPVIKNQKDGSNSENFTGVGVSLPLPIFSLNGPSRAYQTKNVLEAELVLQNETRKLETFKTQLVSKYRNLAAGLKNAPDAKTLEGRHNKIEKLFFSGLVSGALVIEAHRQLFDLEEKRNQTEIEAIEALGQLLIIENKFSGVVL